jgi:hypothetical protein
MTPSFKVPGENRLVHIVNESHAYHVLSWRVGSVPAQFDNAKMNLGTI